MRALTIMVAAATVSGAVSSFAAAALAQTPVAGPPAAAPKPPPPLPVKTTLRQPDAQTGDGTQPRQRFVTVFGVDECPKPTSADEIVVCTRLPDAEQYRIPSQLRGANDQRVSAFEYNRGLLLGDATGGAGGAIGSCSIIGPGGGIGCNRKQAEAWAADRANRMGTDEVVPPQ